MLKAWCSEHKTCSSILDFLHCLNNRIRGTNEKVLAGNAVLHLIPSEIGGQ